MTTLNEITDALETQVKAAIPSLKFYSEGESRPEPDSAVTLFRAQRQAQDCGSQVTLLSIEVSVPIGDRDKWRAFRKLRDYISHEGDLSIEAAIKGEDGLGTLGIDGCSVEVKLKEQERTRPFADGTRVAGFIQLEILHD